MLAAVTDIGEFVPCIDFCITPSLWQGDPKGGRPSLELLALGFWINAIFNSNRRWHLSIARYYLPPQSIWWKHIFVGLERCSVGQFGFHLLAWRSVIFAQTDRISFVVTKQQSSNPPSGLSPLTPRPSISHPQYNPPGLIFRRYVSFRSCYSLDNLHRHSLVHHSHDPFCYLFT